MHINEIDEFKTYSGITSIHFTKFEPVGAIVLAFDNGMARVWQSQIKNANY